MPTKLLRPSPLLLVLSLLLGYPCPGEAAGLHPYEAVYESKVKGFNIHLKRRLVVGEDGITVSVDARRFMFGIHESSHMTYLSEAVLRPLGYVHDRKGSGSEHDKNLVFNWENNTVSDLLAPQRQPMKVDNPCYDKLGYQTQIRLDLIHDPDLKEAEYAVSNSIRNRTYSLKRMGEEVLDTPLGKLNTIKFKRAGDDNDREIFFWVATDWEYLLVRMDQTKKPGARVEQLLLKRAKIAGHPVTGLKITKRKPTHHEPDQRQ